MRKTSVHIFLLLGFTSCAFLEDPANFIPADGHFTATLGAEVTKAYVGDARGGDSLLNPRYWPLLWSEGDCLSIVGLDSSSSACYRVNNIFKDGKTADFVYQNSESGNSSSIFSCDRSFIASYPSAAELVGEDSFRMNISSTQEIASGSCIDSDSMAFVGYAYSDRRFGLKNASSLLRFTVETEGVKAIRISSDDVICGDCIVNAGDASSSTCQDAAEDSLCSIIVSSVDGFQRGKTYYITIWPGSKTNFRATAYSDSTCEKPCSETKLNRSVTLERNRVYNLGEF